MSFAPVQDMTDGSVSPHEQLYAKLLKLMLLRAKAQHPNKADGFLTTGTHADSDAEGGAETAAQTAQSGTQN
jgi:hypothetical protein